MILYELICSAEHRFEAWFRDSGAFDKQRKARAVGCPVCGDLKVRKAIMAPALARAKQASGDAAPAAPADEDRRRQMMEIAAQLREHVEKNCDYVGDSFPEEARRIHYGETEARGIFGEASESEARELQEEGVPVGRLPFVQRRDG
jgi:hypothetical protein